MFVLLLVSLFVTNIAGHGYLPNSRTSSCFGGNSRVNGVWNGLPGNNQFPGCNEAFRDAIARGVSGTNQFVSRMAYVGHNPGGRRDAFENGTLLANSEVCSSGSQRTYRISGSDFTSMDKPFPWTLHKISNRAGVTDVELIWCATAPHNPNRWFIYHFPHNPHHTAVTWDRLYFVGELENIPLTTSSTVIPGCFIHDSPHNLYYRIRVPVNLRQAGTLVIVQQTTGFFAFEFNINCLDYSTGNNDPGTPPPPPPPPTEGCVAPPQCLRGQHFNEPATNPRQFYNCHEGVVSLRGCGNGAFSRTRRCVSLPVPESERFACQDWSFMPLNDEGEL